MSTTGITTAIAAMAPVESPELESVDEGDDPPVGPDAPETDAPGFAAGPDDEVGKFCRSDACHLISIIGAHCRKEWTRDVLADSDADPDADGVTRTVYGRVSSRVPSTLP